ncbi:MAG: hypothetical protein SO314_06575 [Alphaproteobacteria bacterium]|nr:hypothetical protein [Alphaproteobacteria bacterium]
MKIKALITLVIGKGKQVAPNTVCEMSEPEAKRLIVLGFAESLKKPTPQSNGGNNGQSNENGGGQPVQPLGNTGDVSKPACSDNSERA